MSEVNDYKGNGNKSRKRSIYMQLWGTWHSQLQQLAILSRHPKNRQVLLFKETQQPCPPNLCRGTKITLTGFLWSWNRRARYLALPAQCSDLSGALGAFDPETQPCASWQESKGGQEWKQSSRQCQTTKPTTFWGLRSLDPKINTLQVF